MSPPIQQLTSPASDAMPCSLWSDAPETLMEWRKSETLSPDPRSKRMANHAVKMERERNAALNALSKIEEHYVDGDDTYDAWKAMGEIAATFLAENAERIRAEIEL